MTSQNAPLLRLATHASVATAGLLIIAKLAAWLMTGSVSILASLADSLMDAAERSTEVPGAQCPLISSGKGRKNSRSGGVAERRHRRLSGIAR